MVENKDQDMNKVKEIHDFLPNFYHTPLCFGWSEMRGGGVLLTHQMNDFFVELNHIESVMWPAMFGAN